MKTDFESKLALFVGQNCWAIVGGKGTGSHLSLAFGQKIERKKRIENPHLTPEQQNHRGDFVLFLEDCAWRVDSPDAVMGGCMDDNSNGGPMLRAARLLVGSTVKEVKLSAPGYDLSVHFDNGMTLQLFCYITG